MWWFFFAFFNITKDRTHYLYRKKRKNMKLLKSALCILLLCTAIATRTLERANDEYLYPVAPMAQECEQCIYLIYQKSSSHLELWLWNPLTNAVNKGLLSTFTPAGLQLLPSEQGFSFVDNGRVRVKYFNKRSPKSIEISEPIYDITVIKWLDDTTFYLSAKERERFGIFQVHISGYVERILASTSADFKYPNKVNDTLFYIEQSVESLAQYCIKKTPYPNVPFKEHNNFNSDEDFDQRVADIMSKNIHGDHRTQIANDEKTQLLINFGDAPIIFLNMCSEDEGYCVEHPAHIDKQDKTIMFTYHRFWHDNDGWHTRKLFCFDIPTYLLLPTTDARLHESILPLLPRKIGEKIYFVDSCYFWSQKASLNLNVFCYDLTLDKVTQKTFNSVDNFHFFVPFPSKDTLFCGGTVFFDDQTEATAHVWINEHDQMCAALPKVKGAVHRE